MQIEKIQFFPKFYGCILTITSLRKRWLNISLEILLWRRPSKVALKYVSSTLGQLINFYRKKQVKSSQKLYTT